MEWKKALANELRLARGTDSQAEVAARSGISDRTIGLIEQGKLKTRPRAETIVRLALATGSNPTEWLSKVGLHILPGTIERLRTQVRSIARLERLKEPEEIAQEIIADIEKLIRKKLSEAGEILAQVEPADELKRQLKKYVHDYVQSEMMSVEPAHKLRKDLTAYVDARFQNIEQLIRDLARRIEDRQFINRDKASLRRASGQSSKKE
jgi:transcriptional regulator with XRE-family HTH domain